MTAAEELAARLPDATRHGREWVAACPVCGRARMLTFRAERGGVTVMAWCLCRPEAVHAALGLDGEPIKGEAWRKLDREWLQRQLAGLTWRGWKKGRRD